MRSFAARQWLQLLASNNALLVAKQKSQLNIAIYMCLAIDMQGHYLFLDKMLNE